MTGKKQFTISLFFLLSLLCLFSGLASAQSDPISSVSSIVAYENVTFTFNEAFFNGTSATYAWSFGDGGSLATTTPSATHAYSLMGVYTVSLTVTATLDAGTDWDVSDDWQQEIGTYTTSITVLPTDAQRQGNEVYSNMYAVLSVISVSLILMACGLIFTSFRSEEKEMAPMVLGIGLLISAALILVVGIAIINSIQNSLVI